MVQLERRKLSYSYFRIGKSSFGTWNFKAWTLDCKELLTLTMVTGVLKGLTSLQDRPEGSRKQAAGACEMKCGTATVTRGL